MQRFICTVGLVLSVVFFFVVSWPSTGSVALAQEEVNKTEAVKKELAALQGTWMLVTHEEDGKIVPHGDKDDARLYTIDKDKMTLKRKGEVLAEGTIDLDPSMSPKHLDYRLASGQTDLIVYIRVGDYLVQCGHRDGKTRPTEFATGTAKGGAYLLVLQRQK